MAHEQRPDHQVGVTFLVGRDKSSAVAKGAGDVRALAAAIREQVLEEIERANATLNFRFEESACTIEDLNRTLSARPCSVLQIVSHADATGTMLLQDIWKAVNGEELDVEAVDFAEMLRGRGIDVALVTACHGVAVAEELVASAAVRVAIGIDVGTTLSFAASLAFSTAFYRSIARGLSIRDAFEEGKRQAMARTPDQAFRLQLVDKGGAARNEALLEPPVFYVIGTASDAHIDVIDTLRRELKPYTLFHEDDIPFGGATYEILGSRLEMARIVMVLFEGQRMQNVTNLEQVARAVEKATTGDVRLFPLYLEGTRPDNRVPFGLRRLQPAFLQDRRFRGDVAKLAAELKRLAPPRPEA